MRDSTIAASQDTSNMTYSNFHTSQLDSKTLARWLTGARCVNVDVDYFVNVTSPPGIIYCPMPFEPATFTSCCGTAFREHCCHGTALRRSPTLGVQWGIALGVVLGAALVVMVIICMFNRCTAICTRRDASDAPRVKITANSGKVSIRPIDKRTLLKTANYTVEQSWDQVMVKFHHREFHDRFADALLRRYPALNWRDPRVAQDGLVRTQDGQEVGLRMLSDARVLVVTNVGNTRWVKHEFQAVCKNVHISDIPERLAADVAPCLRPLSPRLPTIGEEYFEAGDYSVKISQSEIEIKFVKEASYSSFKRVLLYRYPTMAWSKYLQRDCAHIKLDNNKSVTVHLWEEICSVWLSGDGKREWYGREFQELYSFVVTGKLPDPVLARPSRPGSAASCHSHTHGGRSTSPLPPRSASVRSLPLNTTYTVKTLDTGALEIEFPVQEFLVHFKELIARQHPDTTWTDHNFRYVTQLSVSKETVSIEISRTGSQIRKMWVHSSSTSQEWFQGEFQTLYTEAYHIVYPDLEKADKEPDNMPPVESSL